MAYLSIILQTAIARHVTHDTENATHNILHHSLYWSALKDERLEAVIFKLSLFAYPPPRNTK
jgi:hypothetical protein